jgi:predicted AAA+ superfamily ATPase
LIETKTLSVAALNFIRISSKHTPLLVVSALFVRYTFRASVGGISFKVLIMYRNKLDFLKTWIERENRKPLVIRGARQVGKSTIVKLFAQQTKRALNEVNLDRYPNLNSVFATKDPAKIIAEIEALPRMPSVSSETILFLDEIQATANAMPALRYFYEERGDLAVVAAGSLLEFLLADHKFSMPVGRIEYLHMGPLVFTEYLNALGEANLLKAVQNFSVGDKINSTAHARLLQVMRTYCFVGGMPEAVKRYAQTQKFRDASEVHQSIIDTYRDDFPKYIGSRNFTRIVHVFSHAAKTIGKKVKYSSFSKDDQSATIKSDIELLCMARVLTKVRHSHCNGLPLLAEGDERVYKLLFLDIGLANAVLGLDWSSISNMSNDSLVNEGAIAEQFVGQHLLDLSMNTPSRGLHYWLREGKESNAEVDFVCAFHGKIVPVEVKAGSSGSLKSLHQFVGEKQIPLAIRMDTNPPSMQRVQTSIRTGNETKTVSYDLISLPLYLVERIPDVVAAYYAKLRE